MRTQEVSHEFKLSKPHSSRRLCLLFDFGLLAWLEVAHRGFYLRKELVERRIVLLTMTFMIHRVMLLAMLERMLETRRDLRIPLGT